MAENCEVCKKAEIEATYQSVLGTFQVCEKCNGVLTYIKEEEFVAFADIPEKVKAELVPKLCGGWQDESHLIDDNIIYLLAVRAHGIEVTNIFKFCRACFLQYANDEFNQFL